MEFIKKHLKNYATGIIINTYYNRNNKIISSVFKYGYAKVVPNTIPIEEDMDFDIASLTKFFTATLVYKAVEEKKIDLDSSVFDVDNRFINLKEITILQLLSHKTNIWTNKHLAKVENKEEMYDLLYKSYVKDNKKKYVDTHYMILGILLEKIYNKDLKELYIEKIFIPLNLKSAKFSSNNAVSTNYEIVNKSIIKDIDRGTVHDPKSKKAFYFGFTLGHAGIFINSKDLMKFLVTFIDNKKRLLKNSTIRKMMENSGEKSEEQKLYNNCSLRYKYSLGDICDIPANTSETAVVLNGFTGPSFIIDFERKIIIIIMLNCTHNTIRDLEFRSKRRKQLLNEVYNYVKSNIKDV